MNPQAATTSTGRSSLTRARVAWASRTMKVACGWLAGIRESPPRRVSLAGQELRGPARALQTPYSLTTPWIGLTVPQFLQLGHCQWCALAPKPQRLQRYIA